MKIYRISEAAIKENLTGGSYNFSSTNRLVDQVDINDCLLVEMLKVEAGVETILSTSDIIRVDFDNDKEIIDKVILFDNKPYEFWLAGASDLKKSSCIFVKCSRKNAYDNFIKYATGDIRKKIEGKEVTINKIQAYISFIMGGATRIEGLKPRVVVIEEPKYIYQGYHTILKDLETLEFSEENITTELSFADGQGVADTKFMEKLRVGINKAKGKDIKELNWFSFRLFAGLGGKGMCLKVDLKEQLNKVHSFFGDTKGLYKQNNDLFIVDKWGKAHNVQDVDLILNESQVKFHKYLNSMDDVVDVVNSVPLEYQDIVQDIYICKHSENSIKTSKMNYQFLQNLSLTFEELLELTKVERNNLEKALTNRDVLYMLNDLFENDKVNDGYDISLELCKYNKNFLNSRTVAENIRKLVKSKLNFINYGRVKVPNMKYVLVAQDPQIYLNFIATRNVEEARNENCLQHGKYYLLNHKDNERIVMGRNPLSSSQELIRFENSKNDFISSLGYTTKDIIFLNGFDCTPVICSGLDCDGDTMGIMISDDIYNSVIELDTPTFYNTLDGAKAEHEYNDANIKHMTKISAGNFIGSLAMLNAGVLNMINELPLYDTRTGNYYTFDELIEALDEEVSKMDIPTDMDIYQFRNNYLNELLGNRIILNGAIEMSKNKDKFKSYIRDKHKEHRHLLFLILVAQQQAIDFSKTGIPIDKNILSEIKKYNSKPYFMYFTDKSKNNIRYKNSVIDYFARECNAYFGHKRVEFLQGITIDKNIKEQEFSNKNIILKTIKDACKDKFNIDNVNYITKALEPKLSQYKRDKQEINYGVINGNVDVSEYQILDSRFKNKLNDMMDYCLKENQQGLTIHDFMYAIVTLKFKDDYILNLMPSLIIRAIKTISETVESIVKGEHEDAVRKFEYNNIIYSVIEKELNVEKLDNTLSNIVLKQYYDNLCKNGVTYKLNVDIEIDLEINNRYLLIRDDINYYLWKVIDSNTGEVITNSGRVTLNKKEYNGSDTLEVTVNELLSETKKYKNYIVY